MIRFAFTFLLVISGLVITRAQPFANEIAAFKKQDSISFPPKNAILFVGSSSFRLWHDVQDYFPGYKIINRGFGGSSFPDVIRYAGQVIYPYRPRQIVIYCGENDLAFSDTVMASLVFQRFKFLFREIRKHLPKAHILFVSIKPSPSRQHLFTKMKEANLLIRDFLKTQPKTKYVDVFNAMLGADGNPRKELFLEDNLHMNAKGYVIWQKAIKPYLIK